MHSPISANLRLSAASSPLKFQILNQPHSLCRCGGHVFNRRAIILTRELPKKLHEPQHAAPKGGQGV